MKRLVRPMRKLAGVAGAVGSLGLFAWAIGACNSFDDPTCQDRSDCHAPPDGGGALDAMGGATEAGMEDVARDGASGGDGAGGSGGDREKDAGPESGSGGGGAGGSGGSDGGVVDSGHAGDDGSGGAGGSDGAGGSGGDTEDAGNDATDDGPPCDESGDPMEVECLRTEKYGLFVSVLGSDAGDGTRANPYAKLRDALGPAAKQSKRIYVCGGDYREAVEIDRPMDSLRIYGGFDCGTWQSRATVTTVKPVNGIPLTIQKAAFGVRLESIGLEAPSATTPGGSSVAAFVVGSDKVVFKNVKLVAGDAKDGEAGKGTLNYKGDPELGNEKLNGRPAMGSAGGAEQSCMAEDPAAPYCFDSASLPADKQSRGGKGGEGRLRSAPPAGNGDDGKPAISPPSAPGTDGTHGCGNGQPTDAGTTRNQCSMGVRGSDAHVAEGGRAPSDTVSFRQPAGHRPTAVTA